VILSKKDLSQYQMIQTFTMECRMRTLKIGLLITGLLFINVLGAEPDSVRKGFVDVPDGKLYFESAGNGAETIVLIHDGLVHDVIWDNQFDAFAEKYRMVRYDRRGYGRSPKPEKQFSNIEDLYQVMSYLKIDKAILIGMSSGGGLAIDFTIQYPDKVSYLIAVGAVVGGFSFTDHFQTRGGRLTAADYADRDKLLRYFVLEDPYETAPQDTTAREKLWKIMKSNPQNIARENNRLNRPPQRHAIDALGEIRIPVLIVTGEDDIPDVFAHSGAIEAGIPNAKRVIIRNAGHLVPFEQPEVFNEEVMNFLARAPFFQILNTQGVAAAVKYFEEKHGRNPGRMPFGEAEMNALGYRYLQTGRTAEAIELFKLNVQAYPNSFNTYDSLGEAYVTNGDKDLAIKYYNRSLELNPDNSNAKEMLQRLK
jgi:3-oxoadipate enol-lactonase